MRNINKVLSVVLIIVSAGMFTSCTPEQVWTWPIKGKKLGENIIYCPQQLIGDELNISNLFIKVDNGQVLISPVDGKIESINVKHLKSLDYAIGWSFPQNIDVLAKKYNLKSKFISTEISIALDNGQKLHVSGLKLDGKLKIGSTISRGDTLGRVGYSYKKIKEPSIIISVSNGNGNMIDPMTPFGLKSTFMSTLPYVHLRKLKSLIN